MPPHGPISKIDVHATKSTESAQKRQAEESYKEQRAACFVYPLRCQRCLDHV